VKIKYTLLTVHTFFFTSTNSIFFYMQAVREKRKNQSEDSDTDYIGPVLPQKVMLSHKELGSQLLPGEGTEPSIVHWFIGTY
jgi:hypothetical protein